MAATAKIARKRARIIPIVMELSKNIHFNFSRKEKIQPLNPP
jgi:hypothetical protein